MRWGGTAQRVALVLAGALALALPCLALPVAGAYPGRASALAESNEAERELLAWIQKDRASHGAGPLRWNGMMSAVAREHSADMAQYQHVEYNSPRLGTMEYRLHRAGVSAANSRFAIYHMPSMSALGEELKRAPFHLEVGTEIGIGIVSKGLPETLYVTLILCELRSMLESFPTLPLLNRGYRLAGRLEPGFKNADVIVTTPDGKIVEAPLKLSGDGRFDTLVWFDKGRGKYSVEVTAAGKLGPTVLNLMHCYAGTDYPPPRTSAEDAPVPADLRQAEQMIFGLTNRDRAAAGLMALNYDDRLAAVARLHSQDMMKNRFFAHVSPTRGDLAARIDRAGIKARKFTENLANNKSLIEAHRGLMDSPGHRKNILDLELTRVGVGIVRGEGGQLLVTEDFIQEFPDYDTAALPVPFLQAVNEARAKEGARALSSSAALAQIAEENARWMMTNGKLGYAKAQVLLPQHRLQYRLVQMVVLQSTDPPKSEQMAEVLKSNYSDIGVGIVQSAAASGEKFLWTTVLLGEK